VGSKSNRSRRYTEEFKRDAVALVRSSGKTVTDRTTARAEIFAFIETFYNRRRLRKHPAWRYLTPLEIRQRHEQEHALAA
jgi:hypothetical protein